MTREEEAVAGFLEDLPARERADLGRRLEEFALEHAGHHRPIALVTSGGTAADLEKRSVRCLDNFSTGTRGAISVEQFLKRGYAVVHLWRRGSASPYGRVLSEALGVAQGNHGISHAAFGRLFAGEALQEEEDDDDEKDQLVQSVLAAQHDDDDPRSDPAAEDPWLTDPSPAAAPPAAAPSSRRKDPRELALHGRIGRSSRLARAREERRSALREGRLLTIPFRSVEEYLAKLRVACEALRDSQSLALLYLAAAVSDFYVPKDLRSEHKIQSGTTATAGHDHPNGAHDNNHNEHDGGIPHRSRHGPAIGLEGPIRASSENDCLTLKLYPVPKTMGLIRTTWARDAFCVSFKLETNPVLLRQKAERAVRNYGCHVVIGNILETRYEKVYALAPPTGDDAHYYHDDDDDTPTTTPSVQDWPMHCIQRPVGAGGGASRKGPLDPDLLESELIDFVVAAHFDYISRSSGRAGVDAVLRAHEELERKRKDLRRKVFWEKARAVALEWAGLAAGALLSYAVSAALRRRIGA